MNPRKIVYLILLIPLLWSLIAGQGEAQGPTLLIERVALGDWGVDLCIATQTAGDVEGIYYAMADSWWFPPAWGALPWRLVPESCWVTAFPSAHAHPERSLFIASDVGPSGQGQSFHVVIRRTLRSGVTFLP